MSCMHIYTDMWLTNRCSGKMAIVDVLIFSFLWTVLAAAQHCDSGWTYHDNSCYLFIDTKETWAAAEVHCRAFKGTLAEVTTASEDGFLQQAIMQQHGNEEYWLGGTDTAVTNEWRWVDSQQTFTYSNWHPGEPNNHGSEHCVLKTNAGWNYQWNDLACTNARPFICEKRLLPDGEIIVG